MTVDDRHRDHWREMQAGRQSIDDGDFGDGGGAKPPDSGLQMLTQRVEGIERRMDRLGARLDGIDGRLRTVETVVARIDARLDLIVSQMPRWYQAPISAGALVILILGLGSWLHGYVSGSSGKPHGSEGPSALP